VNVFSVLCGTIRYIYEERRVQEHSASVGIGITTVTSSFFPASLFFAMLF